MEQKNNGKKVLVYFSKKAIISYISKKLSANDGKDETEFTNV